MIEKRINYRFGGGYQGGAPGNTGQSRGGGGRDAGMGMAGKSRGPSRDVSAGVGRGGEGTLADPIEKQDYFGETQFGPARKYTGSFLDNLFNRGYRNINPVTGDFQSRLSQTGGFGKSIFGGILGLINPFLGMAYRIGSSLPSIRNYDTLADYARGEFGLFQKEPGINIDKGRRSIINELYPREKNLGVMGINLNDYQGLTESDFLGRTDLNDYPDNEFTNTNNKINNGILDIIDYTDPYQGGTYN